MKLRNIFKILKAKNIQRGVLNRTPLFSTFIMNSTKHGENYYEKSKGSGKRKFAEKDTYG